MTTKDLRNNIDKVLGNSIRCLLPSYWWKRLFHQVADTIDEVANTIDDINDITIVDSESKLSRLDVPNGSVASVYNERKFKFSECYRPTEEDAKLSSDELFAKLTQIKAIGVNYPLPETLEKEIYYTLSDYEGMNEQGEINWGFCFIGCLRDFGWCAYSLYNYEGIGNVFLLNIQSEVARFNEYLSQRNFRYTFDDEDMTDEDYSVLESIFSVVEADTDVYVKGISWEKLAKNGNVDNGDVDNGEPVSTKHIVYIPEPDSDKTISDVQRNENIKVINLIIEFYKQERTELPDIVLSVDNGAYYITPSLCQPANAGEDFKLCVIFTGLLGDGSDLVVVLYQDGTVGAVTRKADTELSTTSTNPVQNKVITSALNDKVGKNELKTINGKSILGEGDITIEGGEGDDGVLRIYASNLFNAITEEMLIPEGEELTEEELTFVNTIFSTNAKTYNRIIEHYNSLSTLSPIGMPNVIIDYSVLDGFGDGVKTSTPASINIANINGEVKVFIVSQNEYKPLIVENINTPSLAGWNLNNKGEVKRLEVGTLFLNGDNTLMTEEIVGEINSITKIAIQNGYIDANMVKLVYPLDMGILEELLAAGASTNAMIAEFGSYFLTSQPIAISYDESLSRNRLFVIGFDSSIITIDIS